MIYFSMTITLRKTWTVWKHGQCFRQGYEEARTLIQGWKNELAQTFWRAIQMCWSLSISHCYIVIHYRTWGTYNSFSLCDGVGAGAALLISTGLLWICLCESTYQGPAWLVSVWSWRFLVWAVTMGWTEVFPKILSSFLDHQTRWGMFSSWQWWRHKRASGSFEGVFMAGLELELAHCHFCPQSLAKASQVIVRTFHFKWQNLLSYKKKGVDTGRSKELGPMSQ